MMLAKLEHLEGALLRRSEGGAVADHDGASRGSPGRHDDFLRIVLDSIPNPFYVIDVATYRIALANSAARSLGVAEAETCHALTHRSEEPCNTSRHPCPLEEVKRTKKAVVVEHVHCGADGTEGRIEVHAFPILDGEGNVVQIIEYNLDATDRKRMEEARHRSEERLKRSQEIAHLGSWELDIEKNLLTWSDEVYRIFGLEPQEFGATYEAFLEHVHPDDRAAVDAAYSGSIREGRDTYEIEHRIVRKGTGEIRWVHEKCEHFRDESGRIARSVGMVHDVTERRIADMKIADLARFPAENPSPVMRVGAAGTLLHANAASGCFLAKWGVAAGGTVPEEWRARVSEALSSGRRQTAEVECEGRVYSFAIVPIVEAAHVLVHGTGLSGSASAAGYVNLYATDVTDRRAAEDALLASYCDMQEHVRERTADLASSERRYRLLAEHATDVIWTSDLGLNLQYVSPARERMSGYSAEEMLRRNVADLLTPASSELAQTSVSAMLSAGTGAAPATVELELVRCDGATVWTETSAAILRGEDGHPTGVLGVTRDISKRKSLESQLLQAQKMEAIGRLAGGVAHDFNNMMQVVTGYAHRVLRDLAPGDPRRTGVEEIAHAGERAAELTKRLLALGRRQVLRPKVLNLNEIVTGTDGMLRRTLGEDIALVAVLQPELGLVKVDPVQIEQVIINLAINARDAMPKGGKLTIETADVEFGKMYPQDDSTVPPGSYVMLAVSDTGHGMTEDVKSHIFEPFFTTKEPGKGTGLGLSTVYGVVHQSGGAVRVHSRPGEGTTFRIFLPRTEEAVERRTPVPAAARQPRGNETVLLVEDEATVRELTAMELDDLGYKVLQAQNGQEALLRARCHDGPIHLLLTDVVLPGTNGREVFKSLVSERPHMKVIYMSGHTEKHVVHRGVLDAGMVFLEKPFTSEHLALKIRQVLSPGA